MKKLISLLIITMLSLSIISCSQSKKNAKQESTPKIKWQEDRGCWCVPDDEMKLLLQEATLQQK